MAADLDLATRRLLADALAPATAETLREDADWAIKVASFAPEEMRRHLLRLAALALAVAEMQARHAANAAAVGLSDAWVAQLEGGDGVDVRAEYTHSAPIPLPAALAALLREAR